MIYTTETTKVLASIKSTITLKHLTRMKKDFGVKIVYNPEFLTEANAHQDFINPHMQVLGGKWRDCDTVEKAYNRHSSASCTHIQSRLNSSKHDLAHY